MDSLTSFAERLLKMVPEGIPAKTRIYRDQMVALEFGPDEAGDFLSLPFVEFPTLDSEVSSAVESAVEVYRAGKTL